ncbi:MAG: hypothetical protein N4A35_00020 [Flavobacteriales bacterium]|jgi:hypothetical protein|nr:hypothetical protein [Flavobacteriales bacterium]
MKRIIYILLIGGLFSACQSGRDYVEETAYKSWYIANHATLTKSKSIEDITVSAALIPAESIYMRNKGPETTVTDYKGMLAFKLQLSNHSAIPILKYKLKDEKAYQARVYYYTNTIKQHIEIRREGKETIAATDVVMDRNYGISPELTLNVLFKDIELNTPLTFHFNEEVFNLGPLNFHYTQEELNAIPTLEEPKV